MTDIDQLSRALKDLEYRVKLLEKAQSHPKSWSTHAAVVLTAKDYQFCDCGKDKLLCRAPDCPSHKPDPMGR